MFMDVTTTLAFYNGKYFLFILLTTVTRGVINHTCLDIFESATFSLRIRLPFTRIR